MKKPKNICIAGNGNILVFDREGQQMPELQKINWFDLLMLAFKAKGIDVTDKELEWKVYFNHTARRIQVYEVSETEYIYVIEGTNPGKDLLDAFDNLTKHFTDNAKPPTA